MEYIPKLRPIGSRRTNSSQRLPASATVNGLLAELDITKKLLWSQGKGIRDLSVYIFFLSISRSLLYVLLLLLLLLLLVHGLRTKLLLRILGP